MTLATHAETDTSKSYITGKVAAIFFQNPQNFYKVLLVKVQGTNTDYKEKEIVVTGTFGDVQEEEVYQFVGEFTEHPKYGRQFQVHEYQKERPTTASGVVAYLSSDKFPGIGKRTAEKIVAALGEEAIDRIIENPQVLEQIEGLNQGKRQMIVDTIRLNHGMEQVIIGLNRYGFGSQLSFAIYQAYKNEALEKIAENPYQLVEDIEGIGFKRADQIATQLGYEADSPKRIRAALLHELLATCLSSGDTYVEAERLLQIAIRTLEESRPFEITPEQVADVIITLAHEGVIRQEGTHLYESSLFFAEWGIGTAVQRLLAQGDHYQFDEEVIMKNIRLLEKKHDISYGDSQVEALKKAVQAPLFILTGGPGTGKTTIINGLVSLYGELHGLSLNPDDYKDSVFPVRLAAPTGRAAKRMNEATGLAASTIHRLLGLNGREKNTEMIANELKGGLLIVDELSMLDTWLANTLFKAIPSTMQVILVGDKDQLPSVGPGQVLHDLLEVSDIPHMELTDIYRQGDDSTIIPLAHGIKEGILPEDFTQNQKDRSFFPCDAFQMEGMIRQVVTKARDKGFTPQDIQVLAPMYRGPAGIDALNKMLQEIFNSNSDGSRKEVTWNEKIYRIGDKVLQLVNVPELNVFNGDMGIITGIILAKESEDKVDELVIAFDSGEVSYRRNEWHRITLAYCCSIHKAQGSEFKMVILPMVQQYHRMLQRNLLYTAVTRSKELLILLGEVPAFSQCVTHESASRLTTLVSRITGADQMDLATRQALHDFEEQNAFEEFAKEESAESAVTPPKETTKEKEEAPSHQHRSRSEETKEVSLFDVQEDYPPQVDYTLTLDLVEKAAIDPMIGMKNITPASFM